MKTRPSAQYEFASRSERSDRVFDTLSLEDLRDAADSWLLDGRARLSKKTVHDRRFLTEKLLWWLDQEGARQCGKRELQRFFVYVRTAHETKGGRWGTDAQPSTDPRAFTEVRPQTVGNYFRWLRTFFLFLAEDGTIDASPLRTMKPPTLKQDQVQPFSQEQIQALFRACQKAQMPQREEALLYLLLDTGARAGEVCGLRYKDFVIPERSIRVLGKGNSYRTLPISPKTCRALVHYLRFERRSDDDPLFTAVGGEMVGQAITTNGLRKIINRLGTVAGISTQVRCSPHTFRHTFAIEFLRNSGDPITLQTLYGHTSLDMTRKYVALSGADLKRSHAACSPVAHLKKSK